MTDRDHVIVGYRELACIRLWSDGSDSIFGFQELPAIQSVLEHHRNNCLQLIDDMRRIILYFLCQISEDDFDAILSDYDVFAWGDEL